MRGRGEGEGGREMLKNDSEMPEGKEKKDGNSKQG